MPVLAGIYRFVETHGLPLDVLLEVVHDRGAVPCWLSFMREAESAGMRRDRALSKLAEAVTDVHGSEFCENVMTRLGAFLTQW